MIKKTILVMVLLAALTSYGIANAAPLVPKVAVLTFDDNWKSQFTNAKPILDQYGFKATFFVVCNYVGGAARMNWQDVAALQKDGMDIESHTMNHKNLNKMWGLEVEYEVGQSKQCLQTHGINATIIATPYNEGWNNETVVSAIAKYYNLARSGNSRIMYLHCDGWHFESSQKDCRTRFDNGSLTFANRYSIRAWSHNYFDNTFKHDETSIFATFTHELGLQNCYNAAAELTRCFHTGIPIIEYHNVDDLQTPYSTGTALFAAEMKYLHDDGFTVLPMSAIAYNYTSNLLYLRGVK